MPTKYVYLDLSGSTITSIPSSAFYDYYYTCVTLTGITIPDSVTSIGNDTGYDAFYGCTSLTAINVNSGNTMYSSDQGVLFNKDKTTLIKCPQGKAGAYAIPNSVTSIRWGAFLRCTSLTSVTFATGSNIPDADFDSGVFPEGDSGNGDTLKTAYSTGKAGTYTRTVNGYTWAKQ